MLIKQVKTTIKKFGLINKGDRVLAAVSGGPDSVALLYVLNTLKKELKFSLHIAHLDHMLRPDSIKDREFVLGLARRLKLPVIIAKADIKKTKDSCSVEEIARKARHNFLFKAAGFVLADKIAIAHNRDDQAETVLMRIIRGTGLYGLNAILPKRKIDGCTIIRPLIEIPRTDIEKYLNARKLKPRLDASNLSLIYFRNKIRNKLLPVLEKEYNPNIKEALANIAQTAGQDYDFLWRKTNSVFNKVGNKVSADRVSFDLKALMNLHPAIFRLIIRSGFMKIKGDTRRLSFRHIIEIEDLLSNRPCDSIVDLPGSISVVKKQKALIIYRKSAISP